MTRDEGAAAQQVAALRADRLGKRYGQVMGPARLHVLGAARVGRGPGRAERGGQDHASCPDGGAARADRGPVAVFGETSRAHTAGTMARVSYLAQDHPLYRGFTRGGHAPLRPVAQPELGPGAGGGANDALGIPLQQKVKTLSGGQQAQVALTMALAKRAPLLALDEPVASLDPIARLEFMRDVVAEPPAPASP